MRTLSVMRRSSVRLRITRIWRMRSLQAQREELGEAMYAQEFGASFVDDFGAVFRDADIDAGIADLPGVRLEDGQVVSEPVAGAAVHAGD